MPDPHEVLARLAKDGHHRVMIEAGSGVAALFLNAGLVDQIVLFKAPAFIGRDGLNAVGSLDLQAIADLQRWDGIADVGLGQERYITLRHPILAQRGITICLARHCSVHGDGCRH